MKFEDLVIQPRTWKDTSPAEIKVFLGILIYMGVHESPRIDYYFRNGLKNGPSHLSRLYMTQTRFKQLKQFFHISHPESDKLRPIGSKDWWHKLEPLCKVPCRQARWHLRTRRKRWKKENRRKDLWEEKSWGHVSPGRLRGNLFI
jgi:hypothetical protein